MHTNWQLIKALLIPFHKKTSKESGGFDAEVDNRMAWKLEALEVEEDEEDVEYEDDEDPEHQQMILEDLDEIAQEAIHDIGPISEEVAFEAQFTLMKVCFSYLLPTLSLLTYLHLSRLLDLPNRLQIQTCSRQPSRNVVNVKNANNSPSKGQLQHIGTHT